MKGLLLKDWYLTKKYAMRLLVIALVFMVISPIWPENGFFMISPCVLFCLLPTTLYSYDEKEKWTIYAESMPVSRALYVTEKYLVGVIVMAAYFLLLTLLYLFFGAREYLPDALISSVALGFLAPAVMLPILLRFGTEKGRLAYLIFIGVIFGGTLILTGGGKGELDMPRLGSLPEWCLALFPLLLYVLSWRLSITLYK